MIIVRSLFAQQLVRLKNMLFQSAAEMRALEISKSDIILGLAAREEELARSKFQVGLLFWRERT